MFFFKGMFRSLCSFKFLTFIVFHNGFFSLVIFTLVIVVHDIIIISQNYMAMSMMTAFDFDTATHREEQFAWRKQKHSAQLGWKTSKVSDGQQQSTQ